MLVDNPLLVLLGRRGRGAIVEALRRAPGHVWRTRELARAALVSVSVASRAVAELASLGAVRATRPGRDARIEWQPGPAAAFLEALVVPDIHRQAAEAFAAQLEPGTRVVQYVAPGHAPDDPRAPLHLAILSNRDPTRVLDACLPALDALRQDGYPAPDVSVVNPRELANDDWGQAIGRGRLILAPG